MKTDLHIHTYYSDGVFSPEKIVDTAMDKSWKLYRTSRYTRNSYATSR